MAGGRGGVGVVQLKADDPQAHRQRAQQRGHAGQREAVLPPGDPGHPPPRHRPQARVLLRTGGHGQRGHFVTSDGSRQCPAAGRAGQRRGAGLAQVGQGEFFQADRVRLPARRDRIVRGGPDQQVGLRLAAADMHHRPFGIPVGLGGRAGQHAVAGEQVVDLAGHLHPAPRQQDEVVGHPLELGEHVRGQQHRHAVVGHRRQHRGHEVVPGERVEHRHRLIEHQQPRPPGQRQGQRELRLLAAGQLAGLPLQRDAQLAQPGLGVGLVEAPVQVAGQVQHVRGRQVLVQRRVLGDERDAVQRGRRPGAAGRRAR